MFMFMFKIKINLLWYIILNIFFIMILAPQSFHQPDWTPNPIIRLLRSKQICATYKDAKYTLHRATWITIFIFFLFHFNSKPEYYKCVLLLFFILEHF